MATVDIKLVNVNERSGTGSSLSIADSVPAAEQIITSSAASQATTITAEAGAGVWIVKAIGGAVRVKAGVTPSADATSGWHVSDGETLPLGVTAGGEKLAVIDA